jgi:hypothetical protein
MQDKRFYPNKQKIDIINGPNNGWTVENFEGFFLIDYTMIEAIHQNVTPNDAEFTSPLIADSTTLATDATDNMMPNI